MLLMMFSLWLSGCLEQETTGDTTQRELDRQKVAAASVQQQYERVAGKYHGQSESSQILLDLDTAMINGGGLVPQPTLIGQLSYTPKVVVAGKGEGLQFRYKVTSGSYDGDGTVSLTVDQSGVSSNVQCRISNDAPGSEKMDCTWNAGSGARFTVSRMSGSATLLSGSHEAFFGTYVGENADYGRIEALFRPFETTQNGSLVVPQLSIVGRFLFVKRSADTRMNGAPDEALTSGSIPFKDGEFDPSTSTLVIQIAGDNPIVVNCKVESTADLHCTWVGNHGKNGYEEFDLKKAN